MQAIKQIIRIPENHEIRIKVPSYLPKNELMEVILLVKKPDTSKQKIEKLKEAAKDKAFMDDIRQISKDFEFVDFEEWKQ